MELPYCEWTIDEDSGDFLMFCDHQNTTARIQLTELENASVNQPDGEAILKKLKFSHQLALDCKKCEWRTIPVVEMS
jgi:hypothetical protein